MYDKKSILYLCNELMEDDVVDTLNQWEQDFVYDISTRIEKDFFVTEGQRNKLVEIFNKRIVSAARR